MLFVGFRLRDKEHKNMGASLRVFVDMDMVWYSGGQTRCMHAREFPKNMLCVRASATNRLSRTSPNCPLNLKGDPLPFH